MLYFHTFYLNIQKLWPLHPKNGIIWTAILNMGLLLFEIQELKSPNVEKGKIVYL